MAEHTTADILGLTAKIVAAHMARNQLAADLLPSLIQSVYQSLSMAGTVEAAPAPLVPAVPWKKSVFPDFIVCLEDGKKLKMLKRHLRTSFNLTPEAYRQKWDLPANYPMVAPNYASHRSSLAKKLGLGLKSAGEQSVQTAPEVEPEEVTSKAPKKQTRRKTPAVQIDE